MGIIQNSRVLVKKFRESERLFQAPGSLAGEEGFEPSAYGFGDRRSTS